LLIVISSLFTDVFNYFDREIEIESVRSRASERVPILHSMTNNYPITIPTGFPFLIFIKLHLLGNKIWTMHCDESIGQKKMDINSKVAPNLTLTLTLTPNNPNP
jgi:hypothetical protein